MLPCIHPADDQCSKPASDYSPLLYFTYVHQYSMMSTISITDIIILIIFQYFCPSSSPILWIIFIYYIWITSGVSPPLSVFFCCYFFVLISTPHVSFILLAFFNIFMITFSLSLSPSHATSLSHFSSHRPLPSWRGTRGHKYCHSKLHEFNLTSWLSFDFFIS